jgi:hypothetical protein
MRYHWGLGVGHCYARNTSESCSTFDEPRDTEDDQYADLELDNSSDTENSSDACESDDSELCLDDRDPEGWDDMETSGSGSDLDFSSEDDSEDDD